MNMKFDNFLKEKAKEINNSLEKFLAIGETKNLYDAMTYLPLAGGKRLRPILANLACESVGGNPHDTIPFGIALELVHNFTLIHDDIMDNDDLRRGKLTVHKNFDIPTAINAGDALFAYSFEILLKTNVSAEVKNKLALLLSQMSRGIVEGQQLDVKFETQESVTEDEYLEMIRKKTALMFETACNGGALIGNGSKKQVEKLTEYGRLLGLGFQIWDDLLDIRGKESTIGKPVGSDIIKGKNTVIIIHAINNANPNQMKIIKKVLGNGDAIQTDVKKAVSVLDELGSLDYAEKRAFTYADQAKEMLDVVPKKNRDILSAFVDYMVKRIY